MIVIGTNCVGSKPSFGKKLWLITSGPCGVANSV